MVERFVIDNLKNMLEEAAVDWVSTDSLTETLSQK
jgi:hypothetical protein